MRNENLLKLSPCSPVALVVVGGVVVMPVVVVVVGGVVVMPVVVVVVGGVRVMLVVRVPALVRAAVGVSPCA